MPTNDTFQVGDEVEVVWANKEQTERLANTYAGRIGKIVSFNGESNALQTARIEEVSGRKSGHFVWRLRKLPLSQPEFHVGDTVEVRWDNKEHTELHHSPPKGTIRAFDTEGEGQCALLVEGGGWYLWRLELIECPHQQAKAKAELVITHEDFPPPYNFTSEHKHG